MLKDGLLSDALNAAMLAESQSDTLAAAAYVERAVHRALFVTRQKMAKPLATRLEDDCFIGGSELFPDKLK